MEWMNHIILINQLTILAWTEINNIYPYISPIMKTHSMSQMTEVTRYVCCVPPSNAPGGSFVTETFLCHILQWPPELIFQILWNSMLLSREKYVADQVMI